MGSKGPVLQMLACNCRAHDVSVWCISGVHCCTAAWGYGRTRAFQTTRASGQAAAVTAGLLSYPVASRQAVRRLFHG